jgi:hypothetical protein
MKSGQHQKSIARYLENIRLLPFMAFNHCLYFLF